MLSARRLWRTARICRASPSTPGRQRVTMRPVSGLAILSLSPSLQMKLTDDYAAGNTDAHKSPVDERYRLFSTIRNFRGEGESRVGLCIPAIAALPTQFEC